MRRTSKISPVQQKRLDRMTKPTNRWIAEWTSDHDRKRFQGSLAFMQLPLSTRGMINQRIMPTNDCAWTHFMQHIDIAFNQYISRIQSAPQPEGASETPSLNNPPPQRMKQLIVRPLTTSTFVPASMVNQTPPIIGAHFRPPTPTNTQLLSSNEINASTGSKVTKPSQQDGLSAEKMALATSETASRLFKFISTPGFRLPRKN
ncbi:uncharacterized protein LOC127739766 [Arachis duranensis]|uniref:Uncharacterized protein LOC127739766 n=1 Tax=Arachis duranensis TaxID=130453 RepID=A0A9C6W9W0_ARADU|nr:uncharacterized protein LOC127739766 [Arachis duranensis]